MYQEKTFYFTVRGRRFGFEYSRVGVGDTPYLDRYILYIGGPTLRLHKFWRGDDDRAPHDHPFWFVTFPFASYRERYWDAAGRVTRERSVGAWNFHYRPATFRHIVLRRMDFSHKPFWTFVVSGPYERKWGFWPAPQTFIYWRNWDAEQGSERVRE